MDLRPALAAQRRDYELSFRGEISMRMRTTKLSALFIMFVGCGLFMLTAKSAADGRVTLDQRLESALARQGFTGSVASTLERRIGHRIDNQLADLGRLLFFDTVTGLNNDNNCSGCHSPTNGFGDTQSIAIGIDNNGVVGAGRVGPRNQRRTPMVDNTALFANMMWDSRLSALSNDPFDNTAGFLF